MTTLTRRIAAALAGPAIALGVVGAAVATGAPAQAQMTSTTCVTAAAPTSSSQMLNPLTRAGQVAAIEAPTQPTAPATSCLAH